MTERDKVSESLGLKDLGQWKTSQIIIIFIIIRRHEAKSKPRLKFYKLN
jgi:hypothetical protein